MMRITLFLLLLLMGKEKVPYELQGTIIRKAIPYVVNFKANEEIKIGFIYEETIKKDTLIDIVGFFKKKDIGGMKVTVVGINISKGEDEWDEEIDIAIILPSISIESVDSIIKKTREWSVLSITMTEPDKFVKAGISIGIRLSIVGTPEIIVNPVGLKKERIVCSPSFMKMVKFIK